MSSYFHSSILMGFPAVRSELANYSQKVNLAFLAGRSIVIDGNNLFHNLICKLPGSAENCAVQRETNCMIN